jgi:hypothetical protein
MEVPSVVVVASSRVLSVKTKNAATKKARTATTMGTILQRPVSWYPGGKGRRGSSGSGFNAMGASSLSKL